MTGRFHRADGACVWLSFLFALLLGGCTGRTTQAAGLELIFTTDLPIPQSFDTLHIEISQQTSTGWTVGLAEDFSIDSNSALPATIAIAAGHSSDQEARIDVTALQRGTPVIFSETRVQIPTDRLAELIIEIGEKCVGKLALEGDGGVASACSSDSTCNPSDGGCMPTLFTAPLPSYSANDVQNDGDATLDSSNDGPSDAAADAAPEAALDGCTALADDPENCGGCNIVCTVANGTAACRASKCVVASCNAGYEDCDGVASTGCEVNTVTDPDNCGACGAGCALAHAAAACVKSACTIATCDPGFSDCNAMAADGCETNIASKAHCGGCTSPPCTGGTPLCSESGTTYACVSGCPAGETVCGTTCVNTATDVTNCDGCGTVCKVPNATPKCAASACVVGTCTAPYSDCDGVASNGCETNLWTDPNNCKTCGNVCKVANGKAGCANSACVVASCTLPFANCDALASNGCETNTSTDTNNCNACGAVCKLANATAKCIAGACAVGACTTPFADCDGIASNGCEANKSNDPNNCGACARPCTATNGVALCVESMCSVTCNAGYTSCTTGCADTATDANNCGACGNSCQGAMCVGGLCQPVPIVAGETSPTGIAVDSSNVYWANQGTGNNDGTINYIPVAYVPLDSGPQPSAVMAHMQLNPSRVAVDSANVYWADPGISGSGGDVMKIPIGQVDTEAPIAQNLGQPNALAIGSGYVFWTNASPQAVGLQSAPIAGGAGGVLETSQAYGLAVNATSIYSAGAMGLFQISMSNTASITTVVPGVIPSFIRLDQSSIYWLASCPPPPSVTEPACTPGIFKASLSGANPQMLASGPLNVPNDMAVDSSGVYWVNKGTGANDGSIVRVTLNGLTVTTLVSGAPGPYAVATDATYIYWTDIVAGTVTKMAK